MASIDSSIASQPLEASAPRLATGTVCGRTGNWFFVRGREGEHRAQVAPSCLLAPEDGDVVLLCFTPEPLAPEAREGLSALPCAQHILAVLSRAEPARGTVAMPGGARLVAQDGDLRIAGRQVDLDAAAGMRARTSQLTLEAARGDLRFGHAEASAGSFTACLGEMRLFARDLQMHAVRLVQKVRNSFRTVEELDDLQAGRTRWEVEGHAQLHARQATLLADGIVKIDGQRVDLG